MLLVAIASVLCILTGVVLAILLTGKRSSSRVISRLEALDQEVAVTAFVDEPADIRKPQERLSGIPWLNSWLARLNFPTTSALYLYQAGVTTAPGTLVVHSLLSGVLAGLIVYIRFRDVLPAAAISFLFMPAPLLYVRRKRSKRLLVLEQQLPDALSMISSALRVGHSLVASLGAVGDESPEPIGAEMRKCFDEQNYGVDMRTSLMNLTRRVPVQDFRIFVAAVLIQRESGGNLAEVLEKVVQTSRDRFRLKKQVSVHTAQGRMTGWVLSFLPMAIGLLMYLVNPKGMSVLWERPIGLKMLGAAIGMDVVGGLIIRKIVRIQV
jgi:tight adherence protein B